MNIKDNGICMTDPIAISIKLLQAISIPDSSIFFDLAKPKYKSIDYYRIASHILFNCKRCGNCCATSYPIKLNYEDIVRIAKYQKIPLNKVIKKYAKPDPEKIGIWEFKHVKPCKFYDAKIKACRIYLERPWSCRIFPFLGIYGTEDTISINKSCPGSIETARILTEALRQVSSEMFNFACSNDEARKAKEWLRASLEGIEKF
jgi:Fe-S-cluster containining protein